jgi:hypothetical protein
MNPIVAAAIVSGLFVVLVALIKIWGGQDLINVEDCRECLSRIEARCKERRRELHEASMQIRELENRLIKLETEWRIFRDETG